jgi:hypothetical protein
MALHDRITRKGMLSVPHMNIESADPDALNSQKDIASLWVGRGSLPMLDLPWCSDHCLPHVHSPLPLRF